MRLKAKHYVRGAAEVRVRDLVEAKIVEALAENKALTLENLKDLLHSWRHEILGPAEGE